MRLRNKWMHPPRNRKCVGRRWRMLSQEDWEAFDRTARWETEFMVWRAMQAMTYLTGSLYGVRVISELRYHTEPPWMAIGDRAEGILNKYYPAFRRLP